MFRCRRCTILRPPSPPSCPRCAASPLPARPLTPSRPAQQPATSTPFAHHHTHSNTPPPPSPAPRRRTAPTTTSTATHKPCPHALHPHPPRTLVIISTHCSPAHALYTTSTPTPIHPTPHTIRTWHHPTACAQHAHSTAQHGTAPHRTAPHRTAQHSRAQHNTAAQQQQHSTAQHSTATLTHAHTRTLFAHVPCACVHEAAAQRALHCRAASGSIRAADEQQTCSSAQRQPACSF